MTPLQTHAADLADLVNVHLAQLPDAMKCKAVLLCTHIWCDIYSERTAAGQSGAPLPPSDPPSNLIPFPVVPRRIPGLTVVS